MSSSSLTHAPAYTHNGKPIQAQAFYAVACDPARSVAIEACAGAGKTWMLVSRILRALLDGAKPQSILAITYTKKAAGEMRERLQEWLYAFAHEYDDKRLIAELVSRGVSPQEAPVLLPRARALYTQLLQHSRSVEIRTFHSWFAQLLSAAPLGVLHELGLPVQYELIEDDSELFYPSWYALLHLCTQNHALKADLQTLIKEQGDFNTREALRAAWSRRIEFSLADKRHVVEDSVRNMPDPREHVMQPSFEKRWADYARSLGQEKTKTPQKAAIDIEQALNISNPDDRLEMLRSALFVKTANRLTTNLKRFEAAQAAEIELVDILNQLKQHLAYIHQQRMLRLTRVLLACYQQVKHEQGVIDMADLECVALRLLGDTETYGWVAERLDARIRQVLIDEFQDTNPMQWQALKGWLSAYAGAGGGGGLSVFIVGDPKQSIYRFRRADPAVFSAACDFVVNVLGGSRLACDHTRRNAREVVCVVNQVFEMAGQTGEFEGFRPHTTAAESAGLVGRLPMIPRDKPVADIFAKKSTPAQEPHWRDSLTQPRYGDEEKLRMREIRQVADQIEQWIGNDGWQASDIKVLSRKKDRLRELLAELNLRQIPWRFADDVNLNDTQEVQDIAALLDVLVSPENNLALAQVLRSPVFGLDDEALIALYQQVENAQKNSISAPEPTGAASTDKGNGTPEIWTKTNTKKISWWDVLQQAGQDTSTADWPESLREAARQLNHWKTLCHKLPPHDLLDAIYNQGAILPRYAQAVPEAMREEVMANLKALLQQSLTLNSGRYATPYNFVRVLRKQGIKSEYPEGADAVELLTIHGAKGLEARGIILLDTDPLAARAERFSVLMDWPAQCSAPVKFIFYINKKSLSDDAQALSQKEELADGREELNALYVAMTRARERLVFSALEARSSNARSWWHRLDEIKHVASLTPQATEIAQNEPPLPEETFGLKVLPPYQAATDNTDPDIYELIKAETGLAGVARMTVPVAMSDMQTEETLSQRFGRAVHRFLELESVDQIHVQAISQEMLLSPRQISQAVAMVQTILSHPQSGRFFNPQLFDSAYNEVELTHQGQVLRIDRLVQMKDGHWWVLDYKSAAQPLTQRQDEYMQQLGRYKAALTEIYPKSPVHAALITGNGEVLEL